MTMTVMIAHIYIMHYCCLSLINTPVDTASRSFLEVTKEICKNQAEKVLDAARCSENT